MMEQHAAVVCVKSTAFTPAHRGGSLLGRAALAEAQDAARDGATNAAASETEALLRDNGLLRAALAALQGQLQDAHPAGVWCLP